MEQEPFDPELNKTRPPDYEQTPYPAAVGGTVFVVPVQPDLQLLPREKQPNDYLILTIVVSIVCGVLNITSIFFFVPAIVCSLMAFERRRSGSYELAGKLGLAAAILDLLAISWVMVIGIIIAGSIYGSFATV